MLKIIKKQYIGRQAKQLLMGLTGLFVMLAGAQAQTIEPITWNVVGLDSNNTSVGPNVFPIGARICNTTGSTVTNWQAKFNWVTTSAYIARTSPQLLDVGSLAASACRDIFHEVTISRDSAAYDQRAQYNIEVVEAGASLSPAVKTPTNREIYVERLISQNRNSVNGYSYNGTTVNPGGSITIQTGQTFDLELRASTATQGYEQLEKFIELSPAYFRVNKITSTYSANSGTDPDASNKLYADGCGWQNDITATSGGVWEYHNNLSCKGVGKYGGTITQKYNITVLAAPSGASPSVASGALIYDFSGSSYHYNSDFSTRGINFVWGTPTVVDSADVSIKKTANSDTGGGNQSFTLTVTNAGPGQATGVVVTDTIPDGYSIDNNQTWPSGAVQTGSTITWTIGTMAPNTSSDLQIKVNRLNSGNYLNTASVNCASIDPDCSNNSSTAQISAVTADLAITKVVQKATVGDKTPPTVGEPIKFVISVTNSGPGTAAGVAVNDAIPSGYTVGTVTPSGSTTWSAPTWTIGSLLMGATATLEVNATVNSSGNYVNQATVSSTTNDPNMGNNTATADATPTYLSLTKTASSAFLAAGSTGTFTITASKTGPANLGTITVTDVVPAGMTLLALSGDGWTCNVNTKQCTRPDEFVSPAAGAYPAITVSVRVSGSQPAGNLTNYSSVSSSLVPSSYAQATSTVAVIKTYPDINATFVGVQVAGNLATNDLASGSAYSNSTVLSQSPSGSTASLVVSSNGTYTFTANMPGVYVYSVPVCPAGITPPNCPTERLTITVTDPQAGPNQPPVANTDIATTRPATAVVLNTLANDQATAPGATLVASTVQVTTLPSNGTVSVNSSTGAITYTPNAGFTGVDTYVYQVCDSQSPALCTSAVQQVTIVDPTRNSTLAADDYAYTSVNIPVSGDVKLNDVDPQGNTQTVQAQTITEANKGTLVLNASGSYTFTPVSGFTGPVSFPYQTCDNGTPQACANATLYLLVGPLPEPQPDINATYVNVAVQGDVATNDGLPPGASYGNPGLPSTKPAGSTATLTMNADGSYQFTGSLPGVYVYDVPVCAAGQTSPCPTQTLTITVKDPAGGTVKPVANTDIAVTPRNTAVTLNTLSNDMATAPGATLVRSSVRVVSGPASGTAVVNTSTGSITFTPANNFAGVATYVYEVCDSQTPAQCTQAVQKVTVLASGAPNSVIAADDYVETKAGSPVSGNVLGNDIDPEGYPLTVTPQTTTINGKGTLVLNADGSFTFTPAAGYVGPVNFPYQVCDNQNPKACADATIYILVAEAPPAPQSIPTLGEWAMIFMASMMAMFGIAVIRRRV